jgi:hypothetical protein
MGENLLKWGLILGSAYVLTRAVAKEKILTDHNVRNTAIGGAIGYLGGPKLEEMLKTDKKQAAYIAGGAAIGYLADQLISNGSLKKAIDAGKQKLGLSGKSSAET